MLTPTYGVDSCQQELSYAAQDLSDSHLLTEQQMCQVCSLHILVHIHLLLDLLYFFQHQPLR